LLRDAQCLLVMIFQALQSFSSALASGQLGPLMREFGLDDSAVDAAQNGGDVRYTTTRLINCRIIIIIIRLIVIMMYLFHCLCWQ